MNCDHVKHGGDAVAQDGELNSNNRNKDDMTVTPMHKQTEADYNRATHTQSIDVNNPLRHTNIELSQ